MHALHRLYIHSHICWCWHVDSDTQHSSHTQHTRIFCWNVDWTLDIDSHTYRFWQPRFFSYVVHAHSFSIRKSHTRHWLTHTWILKLYVPRKYVAQKTRRSTAFFAYVVHAHLLSYIDLTPYIYLFIYRFWHSTFRKKRAAQNTEKFRLLFINIACVSSLIRRSDTLHWLIYLLT